MEDFAKVSQVFLFLDAKRQRQFFDNSVLNHIIALNLGINRVHFCDFNAHDYCSEIDELRMNYAYHWHMIKVLIYLVCARPS